jgi:hypothetical protein
MTLTLPFLKSSEKSSEIVGNRRSFFSDDEEAVEVVWWYGTHYGRATYFPHHTHCNVVSFAPAGNQLEPFH